MKNYHHPRGRRRRSYYHILKRRDNVENRGDEWTMNFLSSIAFSMLLRIQKKNYLELFQQYLEKDRLSSKIVLRY